MPVPFSRRSGRQVGRTCGTYKTPSTTDSDPDRLWLTKTDSDPQGLQCNFFRIALRYCGKAVFLTRSRSSSRLRVWPNRLSRLTLLLMGERPQSPKTVTQ